MKKLILLLLITTLGFAQAPTKNANGFFAGTGTMNASAVGQFDSTSKGFLFPRMTTTQRNAIASPATSLVIFNTTTGAYNYWNGTAWTTFGGGVSTLQEVLDNNHDLVDNNNFQGTEAGEDNTGTDVNASGFRAAVANTGTDVNAFGQYAAKNNTAQDLNAFGQQSAQNNTGTSINAFGLLSAENNTGNDVNASGSESAQNNTGDNVNSFGWRAGKNNTFKNVNLFGYNATADADNQTVFSKWVSGVTKYLARLSFNNITADRKWELPNASGTIALLSDITGGGFTVISTNTTANNDTNYSVVANATFTDPTPVEGKGYIVFVRNGTATIGGVGYTAGRNVYRFFHSGAWSSVVYVDKDYVDTALNLKANLASPTFTGTPSAPTPTANDNSTKVATTAYVDAKVQNSLTASTSIAPSATAVNNEINKTRKLIIANSASTVTGTTTEAIISSLLIPANSFDSLCDIWTTFTYAKNTATAIPIKMYYNTTNSLSGATQLALYTTGSFRNGMLNRKYLLNGTGLDLLTSASTTSLYNSELVDALFTASTVITIAPTSDIYFIYTVQNDAVGTTFNHKRSTVEKLKLN